MTARGLVHRTLDFTAPARVPRQIWILPWADAHYPDRTARLRARFPRRLRDLLHLAPRREVYAQVKAVALVDGRRAERPAVPGDQRVPPEALRYACGGPTRHGRRGR